MKARNIAAAAVGLLSAVTFILFIIPYFAPSRSSHHSIIIIDLPESGAYGSETSESKTPESKPESIPESNVSDISEPSVPASPIPDDQPKYDDPDSYIYYDYTAGSYLLTDEEAQIGSESLFVGDSICLGFSTWGVVSSKNVYATGSVSANNFFTYEMYYRNDPEKFVNVLNTVKPKHIFLWMGMNDVNLTSAEEYCENYKKIVDTALANSSADVYVCAITPISRLEFTKPEYIIEFNKAIKDFTQTAYKERVYTIDFGEPLKNADGLLDEQFNGGDGIHLSQKAYYVAMHEINKQMKR